MNIIGMDTMQLNFDQVLFPIKENTRIENGIKKYTNMILSNTVDNTVTDFEKLSITIPSNDKIDYTLYDNYSVISSPIRCTNKIYTCKKSIAECNISNNCINTIKQIQMSTNDTKIGNKTNVHSKMVNKKQKNLSFSNEKLWEINRVNQILHKKISNGIKPTYSRLNPSKLYVKATSTINRERKNKDIIIGNKVSFNIFFKF